MFEFPFSPSQGWLSHRAQRLSKAAARTVASALVFRVLLPPHPGPLPLGGGEGESFAARECLFAVLSSFLRIHQ